MARNDGRTRASNVFGKPGTTFPWGNTAYPRIVEERTASQETPLKPFLAEYDKRIPGVSATPKLTAQNSEPGDNTDCVIHEVYEVLPGVVIVTLGFNEEYNTGTTTYRQRVALPAVRDIVGQILNGEVIVSSDINPGESTVVGEKITTTWAIPASRTEYDSIGYQFPAQFQFLSGWVIPATPFHVEGPYPGVSFTLTAHRTLSTAAETDITYSYGPTGLSGVTIYFVTTPGQADRFFGIGANTIHNAIFIQESGGAGTLTVEDLPASTPSSYTPGQTLVIRASERQIMPGIYEQRVTSCSE